MKPVKLTFFCELGGKELDALFSDPSVIPDLQQLDARVALGILDLGRERARVVRRLNESGIPVIAWQLLPKEQGYWYHVGNAQDAIRRYEEFSAWTARHGLQWVGMGVDIEPDIGEFQQLMTHKMGLLRSLFRRGIDRKRVFVARAAYCSLVMQMENDGYWVESYEFPFVEDELKVGSTLLRCLMGITDIPVKQRVLMLYTSFFRPHGVAFLCCYAREADAVAIGITGGGIDLEGVPRQPPLNWDELSRDLRLAGRWCDKVHVFSLEGCVHQGFLARLRHFDWEQTAVDPQPLSVLVGLFRKLLQTALWFSAHPLVSLVTLTGIVYLFIH